MDTTFAYQCLHHKTYAQYLRYETYKTAYVIHPIGAAIKEFGIVLDGCLKAEKYTVNGDDVFCAYFEDNDIFPEFLYFTGNKIYSYSLIAVKKTEVAWMPASVFERMIQEDHDMLYSFMLYIAHRGMKNQTLLNCLHYQTIHQRIAFWLLSMNNLSQDEHIPLPRSQTVWASPCIPLFLKPGTQAYGERGIFPHQRPCIDPARSAGVGTASVICPAAAYSGSSISLSR